MKDYVLQLLNDNSGLSQFLSNIKIEENRDNSISVFCKSLLIFKLFVLKKGYSVSSKIEIDYESKYNEKLQTYRYRATEMELAEIIQKIMVKTDEFIINNYHPEIFGCCSRYVECSDNRQCIHPDLLRAKGCQYRKNLEIGRIFYGKNKNI